MSLTTIGFGDMVPGSDQYHQARSNVTIWFCSIYIMSGMALTAMCFNVIHDELVHRLKHQEKEARKHNQTNFPEELNVTDPYNLTSWQFNSQIKTPSFYHRNLTEETLLSTSTPTSLVDLGHEMVPVNSKIPEVLEGPVMTGVYTLPEEPEIEDNGEENTQM